MFFSMASNLFSQTTLYISPKKADCTGLIHMKCLQIKFIPEENWQNFSGEIEGFEYEEGYEYEITVDKTDVPDPPADAPSFRYVFKNLIEKKIPVVILLVANRYTECEDIKIYKCLLAKESTEDEWKPLNQGIEGFSYREGYEYELEAEKKLMTKPEEQGYLYNYVLKKIISEKPVMVIPEKERKFLDNNEFTVRRMRSDNKLIKVRDDNFKLSFDLLFNSVRGNDGCNEINGKIQIIGKEFRFSEFVKTRMYCENLKTDKLFHELAGKVSRYKISGGYLRLYEGKKLLMEFETF
ncbi:MAG: DUF4377 domain-containing protein [Bacteroidetes bacterium]|nr:DUF4377 domain-containing protein [Bacteroidota bacterium]